MICHSLPKNNSGSICTPTFIIIRNIPIAIDRLYIDIHYSKNMTLELVINGTFKITTHYF